MYILSQDQADRGISDTLKVRHPAQDCWPYSQLFRLCWGQCDERGRALLTLGVVGSAGLWFACSCAPACAPACAPMEFLGAGRLVRLIFRQWRFSLGFSLASAGDSGAGNGMTVKSSAIAVDRLLSREWLFRRCCDQSQHSDRQRNTPWILEPHRLKHHLKMCLCMTHEASVEQCPVPNMASKISEDHVVNPVHPSSDQHGAMLQRPTVHAQSNQTACLASLSLTLFPRLSEHSGD